MASGGGDSYSRSLDDYIDVAQRIADFRAQYPEGSLRPLPDAQGRYWQFQQAQGFDKNGELVTQWFVVVVAAAYRHPMDPAPGVGMAWEIFPGRTPYTRGSELQNAETSAWGRAIIAVGASDSKKGIASRDEVRNRDAERLIDEARAMRRKDPEVDSSGAATEAEIVRISTGPEPGTQRGPVPASEDLWATGPSGLAPETDPEDLHGTATADQIRSLQAQFAKHGIGKDMSDQMKRAAKIAWLVHRFGPDIHSSKDLSYNQAAKALQELT